MDTLNAAHGTTGIAIHTVFTQLQEVLALDWRAPQAGAERRLGDRYIDGHRIPMVGYLNSIHPPQVQIVGHPEHAWLRRQPDAADSLLTSLTAGPTQLVIACDGQHLDSGLARALGAANIAVFASPASAHRVAYHLRHLLGEVLAPRLTVHGVFLDVLSVGLLLTGQPGIGKSELALELISRGHRLIADDGPEFALLGPDDVSGRCPPILQDFLEVRGLGILNIRAMFGEAAIKRRKQLSLIIRLTRLSDDHPPQPDRLGGARTKRRLLDVDMAQITLPVAAGHNLAVLVEAACRDHLLRQQGYNSNAQFAARQAHHLREDSCD